MAVALIDMDSGEDEDSLVYCYPRDTESLTRAGKLKGLLLALYSLMKSVAAQTITSTTLEVVPPSDDPRSPSNGGASRGVENNKSRNRGGYSIKVGAEVQSSTRLESAPFQKFNLTKRKLVFNLST